MIDKYISLVYKYFTFACDPCILMMATVVFSPSQTFAFTQLLLQALAVDVIQENEARSVAEVGVSVCRDGITTPNLLAHYHSIIEDPVVITHRPPITLVVDLDPALTGIPPIHQTDGAIA